MITYDIDDLFSSVNDIYGQFDEGEMLYEEAISILMDCCRAFLASNEEMENESNEE
jgi:GGDEF domain-containing protein